MSLERHAGLDRLKAAVTLLVVFHHTAITYGAEGGWFYREEGFHAPLSTQLLVFFCTLNQAWFMGLFFLLAGYFTPAALQRKGAVGYLRDRAVRLGLPLLAFGLLLGPMTIALVQSVRRDQPFLDRLLALWQRGRFEVGPMWFALALLILALLTVLVHRWRPRAAASSPFPTNRRLLAAALVCGAMAFALRLVWPVGTNVWGLQLGHFASYVILYAAGCAAADHAWLDRLRDPEVQAQVRRWKRITWITVPTLLPLALLAPSMPVFQAKPTGGWNLPALMYAYWEPFVAWGVILALLARAQRSAERPHSAFEASLARRAYAIFVIHPLPLVAISLAWRGVHWHPLIKFALTGSAACVACYLIAGVLLRVPALRRVL